MGLRYLLRAGLEDGQGAEVETDISDLVVGLEVGGGGGLEKGYGLAAPAVATLRLRDVDRRLRGRGTGALADGARVVIEAYRALDEWDDLREGESLTGRVTDGLGWEMSARAPWQGVAGGVKLGRVSGRPRNSYAWLNAEVAGAPLIAWFRRVSNGLGGLLLVGDRSEYLQLRFTDDESVLERVIGNSRTALGRGVALASGEWVRLEMLWEGQRLRVFRNGSGQDWRAALIDVSGVTLGVAGTQVGIWSGFRNDLDRWGDFGIGRRVFTGFVYRPSWSPAGDVIEVECRDEGAAWRERLVQGRVTAGGGITEGRHFRNLAQWAGVPTPAYQDFGVAVPLWAGPPFVQGEEALETALGRLARELYATVWVDGLGILRFEGTGQAAFELADAGVAERAEVTLASGQVGVGDVSVDGGWDDLERSMAMVVRRPVNKGSRVVYEGTDAIEVPAGGTAVVQVVLGRGRYYDASGLTAPRDGLEVNTEADGSGGDAKSAVSVAVVEVGGGGLVTFTNSRSTAVYVREFSVFSAVAWEDEGGLEYRLAVGADGADRRIECRYVGLWAAAQRLATARLAYTGRLRRLYRVEVFDAEGRGMCELLKTRVGQGVRVEDEDGDWGFEGSYSLRGWRKTSDGWELDLREG